MAKTIQQLIEGLSEINGFLLANLVDGESGMSMASFGHGIDVELDSAVGTNVVDAINDAITKLGLPETIEDTLITLDKTYQLIRPLRGNKNIFLHLALDRQRANLAMARHTLRTFEEEISASFS